MNPQLEQEEINHLESDLSHLEKTIQTEREEMKKAERGVKHAQDAQEILQLVSKAVQQHAHERISKVVTSCLEAVFGEDAYEFKIEFEMARGRTQAKLKFVRDGLEVDPMTAAGGGAIDIASFALRAACLVLHRPRLSPVLCLDEPFRFVSAEYQDNVRSMLENLASDLGIQVVMVTHCQVYETGKIIRL